jgi:hypothetical protein
MAEIDKTGAPTEGTASDISDEVGLVRPAGAPALRAGAPVSIPQPPTPPAPVPQAPVNLPPAGPDIHADIEKILKEVKLPERRDFKTGADVKKSAAVTPPPPAAASTDFVPNTGGLTTTMPTSPDQVQDKNQQSSQVSAVHTLKDDLQHAVKEKKMSLVRAVALEQDKKSRATDSAIDFGRTVRRKRMLGILFSTFIFIFLGLAALFGVYIAMQSREGLGVPPTDSIIFAEQALSLPLTAPAKTIKDQIAAFRSSPGGALGSIIRIRPVMVETNADKEIRRDATFSEFLSEIGAHPPEELTRALGEKFFFGVHVVDKNAPMIVVPVLSYDHAFAGMLEWEQSINPDLAPAFTRVPVMIYDENNIPSAREFKDSIVRNYDIRELRDNASQVVLYYSFPNTRLLIIAESLYSFPEILNRLQAQGKL